LEVAEPGALNKFSHPNALNQQVSATSKGASRDLSHHLTNVDVHATTVECPAREVFPASTTVNAHEEDSLVNTGGPLNRTTSTNEANVRRHNTIVDVIGAAVSKQNDDRDFRAKTVIIAGMPEREDDDTPQVLDLLSTEFSFVPGRIRCDRVGKHVGDRPRLLRVALQSSSDASWLVAEAPKLRKSSDSLVRRTIFINRNLSYNERRIAYEARKKRRDHGVEKDFTNVSGLGHMVVVNSSRQLNHMYENTARGEANHGSITFDIDDEDEFPRLTAGAGSNAGIHPNVSGVHHGDSVARPDISGGQSTPAGVHPISTGVHPIESGVHPNIEQPTTSAHPISTGVHPVESGVHPNIEEPITIVPSTLTAAQPFGFGHAEHVNGGTVGGRPTTERAADEM
jgi:hypothetical protein